MTMKELANLTGLNHDGGTDNRLFYDDDRINVYAHLMTQKEYKAMEADLNKKSVQGEGYEVSAWNDASSYKYWKSQGLDGDSNYIQVTAYVSDASKVDAKKLLKDVKALHDYFKKYDNLDQYFSQQGVPR